MNFSFYILLILLSADYLLSVAGVNLGLVELNRYVNAVNNLTGDYFVTFTVLYMLKVLALITLFKIYKFAADKGVKRAVRAVSFILLFCYFVIAVNNAVLIAGATEVNYHFIKSEAYSSLYNYGFYAQLQRDYVTSGGECYVHIINYNGEPSYITLESETYLNDLYGVYEYICDTSCSYVPTNVALLAVNDSNPYAKVYIGIKYNYIYIYIPEYYQPIPADGFTVSFQLPAGYYLKNVPYAQATYATIANNPFTVFCYRPGGVIDYNSFDVSYRISSSIVIETNVSLNFSQSDVTVSADNVDEFFVNTFFLGEIYDLKTDANITVLGCPINITVYDQNHEETFDFNVTDFPTDYVVKYCQELVTPDHLPAQETEVKLLFVDAKTDALLDSVNFSITGSDFSDSGTYDYYVTYNNSQLTEGNTYSYTASREGYQPVSGSFTFTGGQVIKLYFKPDLTSEITDPTNNTALTFTVIDSETKEPIEGTYVTVNGETKITNSNGFTWFEVSKNNTYSYTVSAQGYFTVAGSVDVGAEQKDVTVELIPVSSIQTTVTDGSGSGGGSDTSNLDQLNQGINELHSASPALIRLAILVAIMSMFGMLMRTVRRR
jgi:hypothetical protein